MHAHEIHEAGKAKPGGLEAGKRILYVAVALSSALMGAKFYAYYLTESSAILSDALESIINVVASIFALCSVIVSAKPPDPSHPYGHGKIEYFSAGFEGALIMLAAFSIFHQGVLRILHPQEMPQLDLGVGILVLVTALNAFLGYTLLRIGKKIKSDAVFTHGKHLLTDVYTSGGVIIGLLIVVATSHWYVDGLIACLVGANILVSGLLIVKRAFGGLMHASDEKLLKNICDVLTQHRKELWIDLHQLRAWRSGQRIFVDFHLILPRDLSLEKAHSEVKDLERFFAVHFGEETEIFVHLDPCEDPECNVCSNDPCGLRKGEHERKKTWKLDSATSGR